MTAEEYQDILRKYYGSKDRRKMKQKRRNRLNNKLNKLIEDGGKENLCLDIQVYLRFLMHCYILQEIQKSHFL